MINSVKHKVFEGLIWSGIERGASMFIKLVVGIILARLLTPDDFGLIGMILVIISIGQIFIDGGMGDAIIQRQTNTHQDESSLFFYNLLLGFVVFLFFYFTAPYISLFFGRNELIGIVRVVSLLFVINSLGLLQGVFLVKKLEFQKQTKISVISAIVSGGCAILAALEGCGYWSLVIQTIIHNLIRVVLLWILSNWRPVFYFSLRNVLPLFRFGSKMMLAALIQSFFHNLTSVVIGKFFTSSDLGFYVQARKYRDLSIENIYLVLVKVAFPTFSMMQNQTENLKKGFVKAIEVAAFINFPLMVGLWVISDSFVLLFLGVKWQESIVYIQLLAIVGLLYPLHGINLEILKAKGRSDLFLRLEIVKKSIELISLLIGFNWGIKGMIYGSMCSSLFGFFINTYYTDKLIGVNLFQQIKVVMPILYISILMGCTVYLLNFVIQSLLLKFMLQLVIGIFSYILLSIFFKIPLFIDLLDGLKRLKFK